MPLRCFKDFSLIFEREFSSITYYFATFLKVIINSIHCTQWADRKINSQNINKGCNPFWDLKNYNYYVIVRAEEKKRVVIIPWLYIVSIPLENEFYFSEKFQYLCTSEVVSDIDSFVRAQEAIFPKWVGNWL